jgi:hypothetical protein
MPFTPFHLGPGLLLKSALSHRFSLMVFACSQFLLDLEPLFYLSMDAWPLHRFWHTIVGATIVGVLSAAVGKPGLEWGFRWWNGVLKPRESWRVEPLITWSGAICGGLIGAYSHILLDAVVHLDLHPLSPLSEQNLLFGTMTWEMMHVTCLIAALVGFLIMTRQGRAAGNIRQ